MRTVADLQRYARLSGSTLVSASRDAAGRLVGQFNVPDVTDGRPMASAILLELLACDDASLGEIPASIVDWTRVHGPRALHARIKRSVRYRDESVETFASPAVTLADGA